VSLPGVTPGDPTDVGEPDPALAGALAAGDADRVCALLPSARLLVPVVAVPAADEAGGEAEMAVATLVNESGQRGLPVFTCVAALQEWRQDARPVPMTGSRVIAAALTEGYDGVVVDVAGPVTFTLRPDDLRRLLA
jgi:hypothetical protein